MRTHLARKSGMLCALTAALLCGTGCSLFIQNRYSVFGFDSLQTESADQARVWSFTLLGGSAAGGLSLGAGGYWLGVRWLRRRGIESNRPDSIPAVCGE